jgi:hypothetical protein
VIALLQRCFTFKKTPLIARSRSYSDHSIRSINILRGSDPVLAVAKDRRPAGYNRRPMKGIIHPIVAPGGSPPIERIRSPGLLAMGKGNGS